MDVQAKTAGPRQHLGRYVAQHDIDVINADHRHCTSTRSFRALSTT